MDTYWVCLFFWANPRPFICPVYLFSDTVSKDDSSSIHFEKQYKDMLRELTIALVFLHPNPFHFYEIVPESQKSFRKIKTPACPHILSANLGHGGTELVCSLDSFLGHMEPQDSPFHFYLTC